MMIAYKGNFTFYTCSGRGGCSYMIGHKDNFIFTCKGKDVPVFKLNYAPRHEDVSCA